jgi:catechol-2,3-dioxygenase
MGHLALRVRDVGRSADHLSSLLGLRQTFETDGEVHLSANEKHHEVQLLASERAGLDHVGLEVEEDADLERIRDRCVAAGAEILSERPEEPGLGNSMRVLGPMGVVFELYTHMEREPLSVEHYMPPFARRFGHVGLATDQREVMTEFLIDVLGFRISDVFGDRVTWLRCDTDHHGIGLVSTGKNELHHYAFELENWGEIQRYCDHLAFLHKELVWGPGRHGPGRNLYTYTPDLENTIVEAYADLLVIRDEANYRPIDWSVRGERALNLWGPQAPDNWRDFGVPIA